MLSPPFKWKRFWHKRNSAIAYDQDGYFLTPTVGAPESNPNASSFDAMASVPCLILLGEPGAGKSTALKQECERIRDFAGQDEVGYWFDLKACSESNLLEELTGDERFRAWQEDRCQLHLFLDSLDESPIEIARTVGLFLNKIKKKGPVERLYLRIICRTGYWKSSLEKELESQFSDVQVYELAPLNCEDVKLTAEERGIDPAAFLDEIAEKGAVPLAIKPLSLDFLLTYYLENHRLPPSQEELYEAGCKMLCTEPVETRQEHVDYPPRQLFILAARVAYRTIFSGRSNVATDAKETCTSPLGECVTIEDLSGGNESYDGDEIAASDRAIRSLLKTSLFASEKPKRVSWSHHSYAEFLAAFYAVHRLTFEQTMSIIVQSDDPHRRLIPQLQETAAWIATMDQRVFDKVISVDPAVLVMSDVATTNFEDRSRLVDALLNSCQKKKRPITLDSEVMRKWYTRLNYSGFDDQIKDCITDKSKGSAARLFAISIASAGELQSVQEELIETALDQSEELYIRVKAGYTILRIGSDEAKRNLKDLALGISGEDPDDELKGIGLTATWPKYLTAKELFANLTPLKNESFIGLYYVFIRSDPLKYLEAKDLPVALAWAEKQVPLRSIRDRFEELAEGVIIRALENFNAPGVLDGVSKIVVLCVLANAEIVSQSSYWRFRNCLNTEKRQRILARSIGLLSDSPRKLKALASLSPSMVLSSDVPWLLQRLADTQQPDIKIGLAELILYIFDRQDPDQIDSILGLIETSENEPVAKIFAPLLKPVELDSSQAQKLRERYAEHQRIMRQRTEKPLLTPPPTERISILLTRSESAESHAWVQLVRELTLTLEDTHYHDEFEPDVTVLPGWKGSDKETRTRIVSAAKRYLLEQNPQARYWLGKKNPGSYALAGFKAITLLLREGAEAISPTVWKKWVPAILAYPQLGDESNDLYKTITELAYRYAPNEVVASLDPIIEVEDRGGSISVLRKLETCWDDRLYRAVLHKAKDCKLSPRSMGSILDLLLERKFSGAQQFVKSIISPTEEISPLDGRRRANAVEAASIAMMSAERACWLVVWSAIKRDAEFGRAVFASMAETARLDRMKVDNLDEGELIDLYIWLDQQFPYEEDPDIKEAHYVSSRETIAHFRDFVWRTLLNRIQKGSLEAVQRIRELAPELPEDWYAQQLLSEALRQFRLNAWVPLEPTALTELARNNEMRSVESGEQLLEVLKDSLKRLQEELLGETSTVFFLWNECKKGDKKTYRPKAEVEFSDWIKLHLTRDLEHRGIISQREVKIRRCVGPENRGQITDIYVNAVRKRHRDDSYDSIPAIIEVKGSFNKRVKKDMKEQLVDRYLNNNNCLHGLYVIYWPYCQRWDDDDGNKKNALKIIERTKRDYSQYASDLSQGDVHIEAYVMDTRLR
jgi:hypothetical protein